MMAKQPARERTAGFTAHSAPQSATLAATLATTLAAPLGLILLLGLSLLVAFLLSRSPAPVAADAPGPAFSAERAFADVVELARAPRAPGTPEHVRARDHLLERMTALGLEPQIMDGPLSPAAIRRMERWGLSPEDTAYRAYNLVGRLPGRDPGAAPIVLMAHYDSVPESPGAADDATGVAAALEVVRAVRARGPALRPLIVLFTDAEELNLDGARIFFGDHPDRDRVGFVLNLEARGGGGRALMFETGAANAGTVALLAAAAPHVDGGVSSNSLSVAVYRLMQNDTDFSIPRNRGLAGMNFAFLGRPGQYHSPTSTPEALDRGSLQHIGSQALEIADRLLRAETLPQAGPDRVYADLYGRWIVSLPTQAGWMIMAATLVLLLVAAWRGRANLRALALGATDALAFLAGTFVLVQAIRLVAGPIQITASHIYYDLLQRLPVMEFAPVLALLGAALIFLAGRQGRVRRIQAFAVLAMGILVLVVGGWSPLILVLTVVGAGTALLPAPPAHTLWPRWLGLAGLVLLLGVITQLFLPEAGFLFQWTALLAALAAALMALIDPGLSRPRIGLIPAVTAIAGGGWLLALAHPAFLGIGITLPGVLAPFALLWLTLALPIGLGLGRGLVGPHRHPGDAPWSGLRPLGLGLITAALLTSAAAPLLI